jgi:hypothetical protein
VKRANNLTPEAPGAEKRYVSEKVISHVTGRAIPTLRKDRLLRRGPFPHYKINRQVVYDLAECTSIVEASRVVVGTP